MAPPSSLPLSFPIPDLPGLLEPAQSWQETVTPNLCHFLAILIHVLRNYSVSPKDNDIDFELIRP